MGVNFLGEDSISLIQFCHFPWDFASEYVHTLRFLIVPKRSEAVLLVRYDVILTLLLLLRIILINITKSLFQITLLTWVFVHHI